jgi:hypothetical protein
VEIISMAVSFLADCFMMVLDTFTKFLKKKRLKLDKLIGVFLEIMFLGIRPLFSQHWFSAGGIQ